MEKDSLLSIFISLYICFGCIQTQFTYFVNSVLFSGLCSLTLLEDGDLSIYSHQEILIIFVYGLACYVL